MFSHLLKIIFSIILADFVSCQDGKISKLRNAPQVSQTSPCSSLHYSLDLHLVTPVQIDSHFDDNWTKGRVTISTTCFQEVDQFRLHYKDLKFFGDALTAEANGEKILPAWHLEEHRKTDDDFLIVDLSNTTAKVNEFQITIQYWFKVLPEGDQPFFHDVWIVNAAHRRARSLLPSFDEHNANSKATFDVTIIRREEDEVIFNTKLLNLEVVRDGFVQDTFETTPLLCPSSLLFVVGRLAFVENQTKSGTPLRVYYPNRYEHASSVHNTLEVAVNVMNYFEEYFNRSQTNGISIVIASEYMDSMQSVRGVIVSDTDKLLFEPGHPEGDLQRYFRITQNLVAVLAQQWFITATDITRFNDGIVKYLTYLCLEQVWPDKSRVDRERMLDRRYFILKETDRHPHMELRQDVQVTTATILSMIEDFYSAQTIRNALRSYTNRLLQSNDEEFILSYEDLLMCLDEEVKTNPKLPTGFTKLKDVLSGWWKDLNNVVDTFSLETVPEGWWELTRLPTVFIEIENSTHASVSQEAFNMFGYEITDNRSWHIPLEIWTGDEHNLTQIWLSDEPVSIPIFDPVEIAVHSTGTMPYMTVYADGLEPGIVAMLPNDTVWNNDVELWDSQLLEDCFYLTRRYDEDFIHSCMRFTQLLDADTSLSAWTTFLFRLKDIYRRFVSHPDASTFKTYFGRKLEGAINRTGIDVVVQESNSDPGSLFLWASRFESHSCYDYAQVLLNEWKTNLTHFPVHHGFPENSQCDIMCAMVAANGEAAFDLILQKYRKRWEVVGKRPEEHCELMALTCARDPSILKRLLNLTLIENKAFFIHPKIVNMYIVLNAEGSNLILDFYTDHLDAIEEAQLGNTGKSDSGADLVNQLSFVYSTQSQLDKMNTLIEHIRVRNPHQWDSRLNESVARVARNIQWMENHGKRVSSWLQTQL